MQKIDPFVKKADKMVEFFIDTIPHNKGIAAGILYEISKKDPDTLTDLIIKNESDFKVKTTVSILILI